MVDYSETIEVYDIKVGIHSKLNEHREIYMYQRPRAFFDLCPRSLIFQFQTACPEATRQTEVSLHETWGPRLIETGEVT